MAMPKLGSGDTCPQCKKGKLHRLQRKPWMRNLPKTKYYKCEECNAKFLTIYGWAIKLPKTRRIDRRPLVR